MSTTASWERVFANDADGCATNGFVEGDRKALVDAAKAGLPLRVALFRAQGHPVFDCPVVWVRSDQVYAQSTPIPGAAWGNTTSCDHAERALRFQTNPNVAQHIFSSSGERSSIGWNPRSQQWGRPRTTATACEWFVPAAAEQAPAIEAPGWELAYDTRKPSGARIKAFREAVDAGASVRFVISALSSGRQHAYDAGPVWSYRVDASPGWLIAAAAEAHVSADFDKQKGHLEFPDPAQRFSIMVDTNGRYETFIWREPDGTTHQHGSSRRAVRFYVRR